MKKVKWLFSLVLIVALIAPVFAASDMGGCDDDNNDMINPALALCSTHVYNIGQVENPADNSERELMEKIIAMKTTVIAQQIYKQYSKLDAMLTRLEKQLEKAVLINNIKAASGDSGDDDDSGKFVSDNRNIHLNCAQDCNAVYQNDKALECYQKNLECISRQSNNGNDTSLDLRKQLAHDFQGLSKLNVGLASSTANQSCESAECSETTIKNKKGFQKCLDRMQQCLRAKYQAYSDGQRMNNMTYNPGMYNTPTPNAQSAVK